LAHTNNAISYKTKNVVLTTGINRIPNIPTWQGQHLFKGNITHSKTYKNPTPYLDKKVLVVGMGNTGAEIALDLSEQQVNITIAVRSPVSVLPRDVFGNPVQLTAKKLAKFPFGLGDWLGSQIRKIVIGDLSKYGLQVSKVEQAFDHIILATGYRAKLKEFVPNITSFLDKYQLPKSPIGTGALQNLYFVGFDNYKLGGILGIIQTESEEVVNAIAI